jgi:hypothetical protein
MSFLDKLKNKVNHVIEQILVDDEIAEQRIAICNQCPSLNPKIRQCRICLCLVDGKTKLKNSSCPDKKWLAVIDTN